MGEPGERQPGSRPGSRLAAGPRRRAFGVVALIVILAVAGAAIAAAAGGRHPSAAATGDGRQAGGGRPLAAVRERAPTVAPAGPAQDKPGPVLLVPGYGGGTGALDVLAGRIRATGRSATVLRLPGTGTGSLVADAGLLNAAIDRALRGGASSVDVIGFSAGGVAALIWARRDDGAAKARRIITLGSPFHGTQLAAAAAALVPGECPAACRQLVPGSALLGGLDVASPAGLPRWLSLWTTDDLVVTPPDSARLAGAIDVPVQSVCPALTVTHSELPTSPAVIAMVLAAIGRAPLAQPSAAACH
jgi:triacylglycerol lipase